MQDETFTLFVDKHADVVKVTCGCGRLLWDGYRKSRMENMVDAIRKHLELNHTTEEQPRVRE